jgi:hypothetical protein
MGDDVLQADRRLAVIDNQRGDFEAMAAAHLGSKRDLRTGSAIGRKEQRVLQGFGIGEAEWKALHGVEWTKIGDRTYLLPSDALKLSDDQVRAYLKEAKAASCLAPIRRRRHRQGARGSRADASCGLFGPLRLRDPDAVCAHPRHAVRRRHGG